MKLFLTSQANVVLDKIVSIIGKPVDKMSLAFITTAGNPYGDNRPWMDADRDKMKELGFKVKDFDIKDKNENEVREELLKSDVIFVAGGNVFYLLEQANKSGFIKVIRELKDSDKVYIGSSAGSCIVGPDIEPIAALDEPEEAQLKSSEGFNLVNFVVLPHYGKEKYAPIQEKILRDFGQKYKIIPITDQEMLDNDGNKY